MERFAPMLTFIRQTPRVSRCSMYSQDSGLVASELTVPGSSSTQSHPPPPPHCPQRCDPWGIKKKEELKPPASF